MPHRQYFLITGKSEMSKHLLLRTIIILARGEYIVVALQPASLINFLNIYAHHPEERIMRVM